MTDFHYLIFDFFMLIVVIGIYDEAQKSKARRPKRRRGNSGHTIHSDDSVFDPQFNDDITSHGLTNSLITTTGDDLNPEMLADSSSSDINIISLK